MFCIVVSCTCCVYCRVLPRTAKVDLDLCHQPPCLLNEFYFLSLTVNNKEEVDISNVRYVQRVRCVNLEYQVYHIKVVQCIS